MEPRRYDKYPNLVMKQPKTAHSFARTLFANQGAKFVNNSLTHTDWCHIHVAVLVKRGKIIASACNQIGNTDRLRGADMYVFRNGRTPDSRYSQPCHACEVFLRKCMREHGLRYVFYSI